MAVTLSDGIPVWYGIGACVEESVSHDTSYVHAICRVTLAAFDLYYNHGQ